MKTDASFETVRQSIENINRSRGYQIEFNRCDQTGKWLNFTLKSKSGIPGARKSASGRNLACASWHAHGYVMDEIFNLNPDCVIYSGGEKLEAGFTWQDRNIGSRMSPCYFSETSIL